MWTDVLMYEYCCAVGVAEESLQVEGRSMLSALLEDCARIPGVRPLTLLQRRSSWTPPGTQVCCTDALSEPADFRALAATAAWTLVIAPETDGLLEQRCRWVEEAGGCLLGPTSTAVRLTGDKWELARHLREQGVPTPPCTLLSATTESEWPLPAVCKPRHGAGSQATFLVSRREELVVCLAAARAEGWQGEMLLQPFVAGQPVSVAFLLGPNAEVALMSAAQHLSTDGRFHYRGGSLPLPPLQAARAVALARRAVRVVPGLRGYVGLDLVLGDAVDGRDDWVLEINPRLTTSYVGLRALAESNLVEVLLRVVRGEQVELLRWRAGVVEFRADGLVSRHSTSVQEPEA